MLSEISFPPSPFLYPILDDSWSEDLVKDALSVIRAGAKILQIRAKKMTNRDLCAVIDSIAPACESAQALLIVNDRVDVCLATDASGVHLGQDDLQPSYARKILPGRIIGTSTHNRKQLDEALHQPVDYIAIGPIYATTTKPDAAPVAEPQLIRWARPLTDKPIIAIGGITRERAGDVIGAGADGIAVISGLYAGGDLYENVRRWLESIHE